jgi:hypothetical protein
LWTQRERYWLGLAATKTLRQSGNTHDYSRRRCPALARHNTAHAITINEHWIFIFKFLKFRLWEMTLLSKGVSVRSMLPVGPMQRPKVAIGGRADIDRHRLGVDRSRMTLNGSRATDLVVPHNSGPFMRIGGGFGACRGPRRLGRRQHPRLRFLCNLDRGKLLKTSRPAANLPIGGLLRATTVRHIRR